MSWTTLQQGTLWASANALSVDLDPLPIACLTGDAHRNSPFAWVTCNAELLAHILKRQQDNKLCVHVEQLQEHVTASSVRRNLGLTLLNGKVFGWELPLFEELRPVMERCLGPALTGHEAVVLANEMLRLDGLLWQVADAGGLQNMRPVIQEFRDSRQTPACAPFFSAFGRPLRQPQRTLSTIPRRISGSWSTSTTPP